MLGYLVVIKKLRVSLQNGGNQKEYQRAMISGVDLGAYSTIIVLS